MAVPASVWIACLRALSFCLCNVLAKGLWLAGPASGGTIPSSQLSPPWAFLRPSISQDDLKRPLGPTYIAHTYQGRFATSADPWRLPGCLSPFDSETGRRLNDSRPEQLRFQSSAVRTAQDSSGMHRVSDKAGGTANIEPPRADEFLNHRHTSKVQQRMHNHLGRKIS